MLDLSKIVKTLTPLQKGKFNDFATNNTRIMQMWESDPSHVPEEIKLIALIQVLDPEERRQWEERMPLYLEASTEAAPAWTLLLEAMKQYYGHTDQEFTAVMHIKNCKQGNKSVQAHYEDFQEKYHDVPTDPVTLKKIAFLASLNPNLSSLVRDISEVNAMTLEQVVAQAIRLEHRQGETSSSQQGKQQQQRPQQQQGQHQRAKTGSNGGNKPFNKQYTLTETDKLLLAGKLAKVNGYIPGSVAELHAPTDKSNPDAEKLNAFLIFHKLCFICREPGHVKAQCPQK